MSVLDRALLLSCAGLMPVAVPATAGTLCVDQKPKQGCYPTIGTAVTAAQAGDTINVAHGTYREQVIIESRGYR